MESIVHEHVVLVDAVHAREELCDEQIVDQQGLLELAVELAVAASEDDAMDPVAEIVALASAVANHNGIVQGEQEAMVQQEEVLPLEHQRWLD